MSTLYTIIVYSENLSGVLTAVTNVFTRRQINIESISAGASGVEGVHRYTISCYGEEEMMQNLVKQIEKKIDVLRALYFTAEEVYQTEQALYKISSPVLLENPEVSRQIRHFHASMVEVNPVYTIVRQTGSSQDISQLYTQLKAANCILQFARSGIMAVTRGANEPLMDFLEAREKTRLENTSNL